MTSTETGRTWVGRRLPRRRESENREEGKGGKAERFLSQTGEEEALGHSRTAGGPSGYEGWDARGKPRERLGEEEPIGAVCGVSCRPRVRVDSRETSEASPSAWA